MKSSRYALVLVMKEEDFELSFKLRLVQSAAGLSTTGNITSNREEPARVTPR